MHEEEEEENRQTTENNTGWCSASAWYFAFCVPGSHISEKKQNTRTTNAID